MNREEMTAAEIKKLKDCIRVKTQQTLRQMSDHERLDESRMICMAVKEYIIAQVQSNTERQKRKLRIAAFYPTRYEASLLGCMLDEELAAAVVFYLPRVMEEQGGKEPVLGFAPWPADQLTQAGLDKPDSTASHIPNGWTLSSFGIPEPPVESVESGIGLDIVFLPCVAASPYGERLGHGKAFYDRFLLTQAEKAKKIAVCLSPQAVSEQLPQEAHDIKLDGRITAVEGFERAFPASG